MGADRRGFLRLAAAGAAGLAGCTGDDAGPDGSTATASPARSPAGTAGTPAGESPPGGTGSDEPGDDEPGTAVLPESLAWSATLGYDLTLAPVPTAAGVLAAGAGGVAAFGPDGASRWTHAGDAAPVHRPVVAPSGVYVAGPDAVERLDRDGTWRWSAGRVREGDHPHVLAATDDVVATAQFTHEKDWTTLRALGVDRPDQRWADGIFGAVEATHRDGTLYVVGHATAYAYALAGGTREWVARKPNLRGELVGVAEGTVVGRGPPAVVALDAASGRERWRRNLTTYDAALADGRVFVALHDRRPVVEARAVATGEALWTSGPLAGEPSIEAVADGIVLVADAEGVTALDAATGEQRWFHLPDDGPVRGAVLRDGVAYVRTSAALHAVEGGRRRWTFAPGLDLGPLAAGDHGVFVGTLAGGGSGGDGSGGDGSGGDGSSGDGSGGAATGGDAAVEPGTLLAFVD